MSILLRAYETWAALRLSCTLGVQLQLAYACTEAFRSCRAMVCDVVFEKNTSEVCRERKRVFDAFEERGSGGRVPRDFFPLSFRVVRLSK
eukprot:11221510-Lingulodinium_polyedra.AAC.1